MSKYIDADNLKAEIERRKQIHKNNIENGFPDEANKITEDNNILSLITSLQQEQPKFKVGDTIHKKGENTVFPMVIERISDGDYVCDNAHSFINIKYQDDYELVQQEQPEPSCKSCGFYENNCPYIRGKFIPYPNKVCEDYTYSVMQEQSEVEFEDIEYLLDKVKYMSGYWIKTNPDCAKIIRDFNNRLNARKED